jgi:hypothetical protein
MVVRRRPDLVRAHVAVEGGGGPIDELTPSGGEPSSHDALIDEELRAYAQVPSLTVLGDFLDIDDLWTVFSDSSKRFAEQVAERGGIADVLDLPARGVTGNTHVPMFDRNSAQVLDLILAWVETRSGI